MGSHGPQWSAGSARATEEGRRQDHRSSIAPASRTALILYGSETGNAQDVAEELGRMTERLRFHTTVLDLDSVQLRDVVKPAVVLFTISTTGQGEMPQNARRLWKTLLSSALKPGILRKVRFSSFGLGDSSYAQYNVAHRLLHGRLVQLGARPFCDRGEGNEQHPEGHSAGFREYAVVLKQKLLDAFPLTGDLLPIPNDVFIEPNWKLGTTADVSAGVPSAVKLSSSSDPVETEADGTPSVALMPVTSSYTAAVDANSSVTAENHFQDVKLLDLRIGETVSYGPGAVAVVYPKNFPQDVNSFIHLMQWEDVADIPLKLRSTGQRMGDVPSTPSPLRQLNLNEITLTLRWLLENVLDIMSIPRRSFFAELAHFARDRNEDESFQKERLLELANPELIDELWDYTTRPKRTILEVLMDFTTIKIPWQYALSVLPIMRGRQFSIATGGASRTDGEGNTLIQLLVAIVNPPSPIIKWRRRYGVCTRYIASLTAGQEINVTIQQGYLDVQAAEFQVPVVLVGTGTGIAPMRSMVHQRRAWAKSPDISNPGKILHGDLLFFGCRSLKADCFFRDEWERYTVSEGLTFLPALSREEGKPKQYVQDQIRAHGASVVDALVKRDGKVYVCGSSGNMPKGVRQAILDVLVEHCEFIQAEDAELYLSSMEKNGRYKQETW